MTPGAIGFLHMPKLAGVGIGMASLTSSPFGAITPPSETIRLGQRRVASTAGGIAVKALEGKAGQATVLGRLQLHRSKGSGGVAKLAILFGRSGSRAKSTSMGIRMTSSAALKRTETPISNPAQVSILILRFAMTTFTLTLAMGPGQWKAGPATVIEFPFMAISGRTSKSESVVASLTTGLGFSLRRQSFLEKIPMHIGVATRASLRIFLDPIADPLKPPAGGFSLRGGLVTVHAVHRSMLAVQKEAGPKPMFESSRLRPGKFRFDVALRALALKGGSRRRSPTEFPLMGIVMAILATLGKARKLPGKPRRGGRRMAIVTTQLCV